MDVLPLPHKKATGATPPLEAAVQVTSEPSTAPEHETDNASALATPKEAKMIAMAAEAAAIRNLIIEFY